MMPKDERINVAKWWYSYINLCLLWEITLVKICRTIFINFSNKTELKDTLKLRLKCMSLANAIAIS
jgi:hypothetical protein